MWSKPTSPLRAFFWVMCMGVALSASAQKTAANLIVEGFNQGNTGFAELMKQTYVESNLYFLNDSVVKQYGGVKRAWFSFFDNRESVLAPGVKFTQNTMRIEGTTIETGDKKWDEVKEYLLTGLKSQIDYFDRLFGTSLQHTVVYEFDPNDERNNGWNAPRFKVYFYPKTLTLPQSPTVANIEQQLEIVPYFSMEIHKRPFSNYYYMLYVVSGASEQR
ncbi:MAG: hypothetical protein IPH78_14275 [Bacteroidetes bacterium]|nr:hypothetical protein [Bacteroidota bacterium]